MRKLKTALLAGTMLAIGAIAAQALVVNTFGTGEVNPKNTATNPVAVDELNASPHAKAIVSTVAVGNGDSINSVYHVGFVPSNAILDPASLVYGTGIAGLTNVSCGFAGPSQPVNPLGSWAASPSLLVSAQDFHTAASFSLMSNVSTANQANTVYSLLGLSIDPGGVIEVTCTLGAATSATGTLQFVLKYFDRK